MDRRFFLRTGRRARRRRAPVPAFAAFPERPIKLIVPFSPGGATDVVGRLWAEKMKAKFGPVVTENKGGGGGVIGATEVVRSRRTARRCCSATPAPRSSSRRSPTIRPTTR